MFELSVYFWVVDMLESVLNVVTLVDYNDSWAFIGFVNNYVFVVFEGLNC